MVETEFDAVIVGSGVAGALIAHQLATAGRRVLMLEAGSRGAPRVELVGRFAAAGNKTPHAPYVDARSDEKAPVPDTPPERLTDYFDQPDGAGFKSTYERRVGGSTWHWLGHTPRLVPGDFRMRSLYGVGVDWPISYDDLEPWYCRAERAIGVAGDHDEWNGFLGAHRSQPFPMSKVWPSYSDLHVGGIIRAAGLAVEGIPLTVLSTPSARNTRAYEDRPACAGNSTCVPICPIQAKYDAMVHVELALRAGAELREQSVVARLEAADDGAVRRVVYKTWEGEERHVEGRVVVLAANAIESAKILLMSPPGGDGHGLANASGLVGRNLMDHLQKAALALSQEPLFPYRGPPSICGIDNLRDDPLRGQRSVFRISLGNDGWTRIGAPFTDLWSAVVKEGLFGAGLRQRLEERVTRQMRLSCSTEVLPDKNNRVELSPHLDALGLPRPLIHFAPTDYTRMGLARANRAMRSIFDAMGAAEQQFEDDLTRYSGAGHIMGTCRMGASGGDSVVDRDCRAHQHPNLFIVGSGVFPTGGTANPTLTVAALALRAAATIDEQLGAA